MADTTEPEVRERILRTAADLFYRQGVRAVGVDLIIARAGVAKTSLYRHFRTKDELIAAFLRREDEDFWATWEETARRHPHNAAGELRAQLQWIGERVGRSGYRGCPQINVAAEFPDAGHPARAVAKAHKQELRRRLENIARRMGSSRPQALGAQLAVLVNGAFVSSSMLAAEEAVAVLQSAAEALSR
jgi:AcrR family transcriptional regulator